ncbi:MAG: hypothetical protein AMXMBFR6_16510 [Betaproteobacteria bacterium]
MPRAHIMNMLQPVVRQTDLRAREYGLDTATTVMTYDHDVPDLQHIDGELDDRQAVQITVHNEIGDVSMHEYLAGRQPDDLVGGYPTVRTPNPEVFG